MVAVFDTATGDEVARLGPIERLIGADLHGGAVSAQDAATRTIADDGSAWITRYTRRTLNHLVPTAEAAG